MRIYDLILFLGAFACLSGLYGKSITKTVKAAEEKVVLQKKADSSEFIIKSFRNTCDGLGFASFDDWKDTCKVMWKLEYIGYEKKNGVWRGFWKGPSGEGEVFQKERGNENFSE